MNAKFSPKPLRDNKSQGRSDEQRINSQIGKSLDGMSRTIGMDSRKYDMSGNRCLNGEFCSFLITYFSNHNDIRILPEKRSESRSKRKIYRRVDLCMIDSGDSVFYRIFKSGDIIFFRTKLGKESKKSRRFSRTCWSDCQDHSKIIFEMIFNFYEIVGHDTKLFELWNFFIFL